MSNWIKCGDRLPENTNEVFVTVDASGDRHVVETWYSPEFGWAYEDIEDAEFVAWQPKPEPYRE